MDYLKNLEDLLKTEKLEDESQFSDIFKNKSVSERRGDGLSWYPVAIRGTETLRTDYLMVELERTTHQDISHSFRSGSPVFFFTNHNANQDRIHGTVTHQFGNRIKILIKQDELPEWSSDGKLGLDLAFDNQSYSEMFTALKSAKNYSNLPILLGEKSANFNNTLEDLQPEGLNESQLNAVKKVLAAQELAIVHGPPGTGKTTTLLRAIQELIKQGSKKKLVTAPSNTAVDLLAEKLSEKGLNVLRVGNIARVSEKLHELTLDSKTSKHPLSKNLKKLRGQANEYRNLAHKYKRNFGKSEREQRKALFDEAHKILKEVDKSEEYIREMILQEVQVVVATLVGSANYLIDTVKFDVAVIDEAGQALEPACWIPILKADKLVMAGDHLQLPPTIKSYTAAKAGLEITLLEKLTQSQPEAVVMLDTQYRMNEQISRFSSKWFYKNSLKSHSTVKDRVLKTGSPAILFIDTAGCGFDEKKEGVRISNPDEASFVIKRAEELLSGLEVITVGIISPYKQQIQHLQTYLTATDLAKKHDISVNTVDSFQGQERDAIFISVTRSNPNGEIGFLADTRRMNVAITRAKKLLVMVGDSATIGSSDFYSQLIDYFQTNNAYKSAWEYTS